MKFIDYLLENTINKEQMIATHNWLMDHLELHPENIYPIRDTGKIGSENARDNRGKLIYLTESKLNIVFSDNELACFIFQKCLNKKLNTEESFQDLLKNKKIPVAHARAIKESDGKFLLQVVGRIWGETKTHCHIFDAGISIEKDILKANKEDVLSRFIRLTHPINHFLFPKNLGIQAEQNSEPRFQHVAAVFMKKNYPEQFKEFCTVLSLGRSFKWNEAWETIGEKYYYELEMPIFNIANVKSMSSKTLVKSIKNNKTSDSYSDHVCNETCGKVIAAREKIAAGKKIVNIAKEMKLSNTRIRELNKNYNRCSKTNTKKVICPKLPFKF